MLMASAFWQETLILSPRGLLSAWRTLPLGRSMALVINTIHQRGQGSSGGVIRLYQQLHCS